MPKDSPEKASGLRPPPDPPEGADPLDVTLHYASYWEAEFARARQVLKRRASLVVIGVSSATASIAVVGAATSILGWAWLGIVSATLAGVATVIGAWDGLFRHRELWHQRSLVLGNIQAVKRGIHLRAAAGHDRNQLAEEAMALLDAALEEDLRTWSEIRGKTSKIDNEGTTT